MSCRLDSLFSFDFDATNSISRQFIIACSHISNTPSRWHLLFLFRQTNRVSHFYTLSACQHFAHWKCFLSLSSFVWRIRIFALASNVILHDRNCRLSISLRIQLNDGRQNDKMFFVCCKLSLTSSSSSITCLTSTLLFWRGTTIKSKQNVFRNSNKQQERSWKLANKMDKKKNVVKMTTNFPDWRTWISLLFSHDVYSIWNFLRMRPNPFQLNEKPWILCIRKWAKNFEIFNWSSCDER